MGLTLTTFNYLLSNESTTLYNALNGGTAYQCCLITAGGPLKPQNVFADLTEAAYPGYARIALSGRWSAPVKVIDGQYQTGSSGFVFPAPTSGPTVNITGYVVKETATNNIIFGDDFSPAVALSVGGAALTFSILFDRWSRSILP